MHLLATHRIPWERWAPVWGALCERHGFGRAVDIERAGTEFRRLRAGWRGALAYARKYATKAEQKVAPPGWRPGRYWGVRGDRSRGSFHVSGPAWGGAGGVVKGVEELLNREVIAGNVRRLRWEYGRGAVYMPARRMGAYWDAEIVPGLELIFARAVATGEVALE